MIKFRDLLSLFWARSKFNSFAMFDPLMANDGSLKSWDQAEFALGLLVGSRDNYKNELLVHGKQTVQQGLGTYVISALISALFGFGFVGIIVSKPWPLMLTMNQRGYKKLSHVNRKELSRQANVFLGIIHVVQSQRDN